MLDPGLGFAKTAQHNWALLAHLDHLQGLGRPVLVAASRKAFLASCACASSDLSVPWFTDRLLSALSYAVWEMKFCFKSKRFCARVFSASASWARLASRAPTRSFNLASRSAVSKRASTCPALTVSPSRTKT